MEVCRKIFAAAQSKCTTFPFLVAGHITLPPNIFCSQESCLLIPLLIAQDLELSMVVYVTTLYVALTVLSAALAVQVLRPNVFLTGLLALCLY